MIPYGPSFVGFDFLLSLQIIKVLLIHILSLGLKSGGFILFLSANFYSFLIVCCKFSLSEFVNLARSWVNSSAQRTSVLLGISWEFLGFKSWLTKGEESLIRSVFLELIRQLKYGLVTEFTLSVKLLVGCWKGVSLEESFFEI